MRRIASPSKGATVRRRILQSFGSGSPVQIVSVTTSSLSSDFATRAAAARIAKSELSELVVTDTIWTGEPDPKDCKIRRLSVAPLLGEAVRRIADESSVSSLFD